ncbi:MAG: DAK2 domain-containing protein [Lachnospiraceae bacterium]|nr:DAK2 domain-containing protein [Lachnospiraceae bacterium]
MGTKELNGELLAKLLEGGAANLRMNADIVNDLNVFPIPDGDTGDNMMMTINGGLSALNGETPPSLTEAAEKASHGMLLSARGNSGVILSQLFAGVAEGLRGFETADIRTIGEAMRSGVRSAYASVITPTEGTILTVARESVEYACGRINENSTLESFCADCLREANASLQRTPELLAVLKEAGVIDSGGAGLYYIVDGVYKTLRGEKLEAPGESRVMGSGPQTIDTSKFNEDSVMEFGYCTECLLQLTHAKTDIDAFDINKLIDTLTEMGGDSIVAVQNGTVVKIHVHTFEPEKALGYCHQFGEFLTMKVENMTLQHTEAFVENRFHVSFIEDEEVPKKRFGIVTVATGDGIRETLTDLGADIVIDGGQGKNPSTEDFVEAFDRVHAENIYVLPNNGNIVMAARQAAELYEGSKVYVIESKSIGDGYAALTMLSFDSDDPDQIAEELRDAMQGVITGSVTRAVRSTTVNGVDIKENEFIGFTDKEMQVSCPTALETAEALSEHLSIGNYEFVIVIYGADTTEEEKEGYRSYMREQHRRTELCEIDGGQEVYHFLIILQ